MSKKTLLVVVSFYKYLMLILVSVFLFLIPMVEPHQYFGSPFKDVVAKCVLWFYFIGSYFSTASSIKKGIEKGILPSALIQKSLSSFALLSVSAIATGAFMSFLTRWSLTAFTPQFSNNLILMISLGNGVIYAMFILSQYYFLPE